MGLYLIDKSRRKYKFYDFRGQGMRDHKQIIYRKSH